MYKCPDILIRLLSILNEDSAVFEIILIENTEDVNRPDALYSAGNKVVVYPQGKNIFVNPSWNLGAALAKKDYIAILNDDIIIPDQFFTFMSVFDIDKYGVFGACDFLIQEVGYPQRFKTRYFIAEGTEHRLWGFGVLMVMKKDHYFPIPDDLLIWAGDDYLFHQNKKAGRTNILLMCPIQTRMSSTSNIKEFDDIKARDAELYDKKYK